MHRIDDATATIDSQFTEGDPTAGTLATVVKADWLNSVQEEIAGVVEGAGLTLSKPDQGQLLEAIGTLIDAATPQSSTTVQGVIELATNAEAQAQTDADRAITPSTLNQALKGSNQSLANNGYQKLPGGLILQWGGFLTTAGAATITFPIAFPNACLNVQATCTASGPQDYIPTIGAKTATSVVIYTAGGDGVAINVGFSWFAIGY